MSRNLIRAWFYFMSAVITVLLLNSCSTSTGEPDGETTNGGGIGGSGFVDLAVGDITGFSSVIINGVTYDTSDAQFSISGMPASQSDLKVGMNVTAANLKQHKAGSIIYTPMVLGPVTTTSLADSSFEVLGQTVVVDSNTALDSVSLDANASNVIAAGAIIEVSGIRNADNDIVATYIRRADSATNYQIQGSIDAEVDELQQLLVDGLLVDVSGIDSEQVELIANEGEVISLFLTPNGQVATALPGSSIVAIPTINELLERFKGTKIRVEGYISNSASFNILGTAVDFTFNFDDLQVFPTAQTVYRFADGTPATASDLGANSRIELIATTKGVGIVTPDEIIIIER